MRNIASCGSCHGGLVAKVGRTTRRNGISEQMRNVTRGMTPAEIDAARGIMPDSHDDVV